MNAVRGWEKVDRPGEPEFRLARAVDPRCGF
jgi:hypothetical protein